MDKLRTMCHEICGESNRRKGKNCQDSVMVHEDSNLCVLALSDGLSILPKAELASHFLTRAASAYFVDAVAHWDKKEESLLSMWPDFLDKSRRALDVLCMQEELERGDLDATLLVAVLVKKEKLLLVGQVGDGAICLAKKDGAKLFREKKAGDESFFATSTIGSYDSEDTVAAVYHLDEENPVEGVSLSSHGLEGFLFDGSKAKETWAWCLNKVRFSESKGVSAVKAIMEELSFEENNGFTYDMSLGIISWQKNEVTFLPVVEEAPEEVAEKAVAEEAAEELPVEEVAVETITEVAPEEEVVPEAIPEEVAEEVVPEVQEKVPAMAPVLVKEEEIPVAIAVEETAPVVEAKAEEIVAEEEVKMAETPVEKAVVETETEPETKAVVAPPVAEEKTSYTDKVARMLAVLFFVVSLALAGYAYMNGSGNTAQLEEANLRIEALETQLQEANDAQTAMGEELASLETSLDALGETVALQEEQLASLVELEAMLTAEEEEEE